MKNSDFELLLEIRAGAHIPAGNNQRGGEAASSLDRAPALSPTSPRHAPLQHAPLHLSFLLLIGPYRHLGLGFLFWSLSWKMSHSWFLL